MCETKRDPKALGALTEEQIEAAALAGAKALRGITAKVNDRDRRFAAGVLAAVGATTPAPIEKITDHAYWPVNGNVDDECAHRADGTDLSYCGEPRDMHRRCAAR